MTSAQPPKKKAGGGKERDKFRKAAEKVTEKIKDSKDKGKEEQETPVDKE
jgi:hypothetical protein